ncbi:transmembrane protein 205 [Phycodurus eques]|uniref:transmembrane protein 205 n=1 Tax=Phycodurus eques TaxID=693459 RepID=UPI002ACEA58D|nr:transmembrane protein 205 [Phycodurus eques]XP_061556014.1 transmembrane protein 205 [Phycodurus eques]XP_061556015.1 transmembrane protein 205 [Phycodurus eques]XP_061556016.1 transmembrane protein 205 [Phycodurus eques]
MATDGDPSNSVKVLHLLVLSFSWGMQVWVSFIAGFALVRQVTRHTFGRVQSKLFPVYFCCLLGSHFVSLAVYAAHHLRELPDTHETAQMALYFVALLMAGLNAQRFGPAATEIMFLMREVEKEHGLGNRVGLGAEKEGYAKLQEQDPKYRAYKSKFGRCHGLSNLCNLIGVICTTTNLIYTALNLSTI